MYDIEVDREKCTGCGECVDVCLEEVYELQDIDPVAVNLHECTGCEICVDVCEQEAISIIEI